MPDNGFDHQLKVYSDITQLIAGPENPTPIVRLNRVNPNRDFSMYVKLERYNPFGSVKDRVALSMLKGLQFGDKTIVEPSSGNTGLAIAAIANAWGIPVEIAVPERVPEEKKIMLKLLGVTLQEADDALCPLFPTEGARGLVNALVKSPATKDKYISPNQYENELNVAAHFNGTGPEIWKQTKGEITHFFAGFGTCGTITGVGRYLKKQNPDVKVIGVEPYYLNHKLPGMKRITGLAEEYIPKILDRSVIDETVAVTDEDAYGAAIALAQKDGIPVGPTTGAILAAALRLGKTGKGLAVVISPDDAFKYSSFYRSFLDLPSKTNTVKSVDLSGYVCPAPKVKAVELIEAMETGETAELILGDRDSLKSIVQELKVRGIKPDFKEAEDGKFLLTFSK